MSSCVAGALFNIHTAALFAAWHLTSGVNGPLMCSDDKTLNNILQGSVAESILIVLFVDQPPKKRRPALSGTPFI